MAVDLSSRRSSDSPDLMVDEEDSPTRGLQSPGTPCPLSPISPPPQSPGTPRPQSPITPRLHDTSTGSLSADGDESGNRASTPSRGRRKNKRKMSEPRRLSDFGAKKPRVEEDDSGVESTSQSGSADRSPVDEVGTMVPGIYPPTIMVPTYLPYPYTFINPAMSSLQSLHLMNSGQIPASTSAASTSTSGQSKPSTSRKSKDLRAHPPRPESPPAREPRELRDPARDTPSRADSMQDDEARRQYKTMTVERRVEANARERTRVHTISAAFEALRRAVPAYSYNQKLSKLAILRIACCYILSLSRLADKDYSRDQSRPSFRECVELTTRTIQAEGRAKKRH